MKIKGFLNKRILLPAFFCVSLPTMVFSLDTWDVYNERYQAAQIKNSHVPREVWQLVEPYLMPESHPLKKKLDKLFSQSRVLSSRTTLVAAGFEDKKPEPVTKIIVTRHKEMKGYIFKIYTDDYLDYHHGEPEHFTYIRRARGSKLIRDEIAKKGWQSTFKAPKKWIYALPASPDPLRPDHVRRNFILVEEEMDLLSKDKMKEKWQNGTMTKEHLDKLYYLTTRLGLRGCCKYDNVPICKDGKIAFVDTQSNLRWPIAYNRLARVLKGDMLTYWQNLTQDKEAPSVPRITDQP